MSKPIPTTLTIDEINLIDRALNSHRDETEACLADPTYCADDYTMFHQEVDAIDTLQNKLGELL